MRRLSENEFRIIRRFRRLYAVVAALVCLMMISLLFLTVSNLPIFGEESNPANNEVVERYLEKGLEETGAVNITAGIILDYRAFDTFGESTVLFLAVAAVWMLLKKEEKEIRVLMEETLTYAPKEDVIFRTVARFLTPCILLFGIYIILNGHLSPGGGFSGGAVMGSGLILYNLSNGTARTRRFLNEKVFTRVVMGALFFYALAKSYSFFTGGNHLESLIPLGTPGSIFSGGLILPLNIAVGLVVACTGYGIYALFARGGL